MKFLVLGANGQVGHELRLALASLGEVVPTTRSGVLPDGTECEVADFARPGDLATLVDRIAPDAVVNAAAYTAVDRAEDDADAAYLANADAPGVLARSCAERGIPFVHYSTDYVFDGQGTHPYRESDTTAPLGVYGASKLAGEERVRAAAGQYLILRTAWAYASHGKNFLLTMLKLAEERSELQVVADQIGTPTPAYLIADVTARLLVKAQRPSGTFHLSASGGTSWHGFAEAIVIGAVARGLLASAPRVLPIATADFPTRARRPAFSKMNVTAIESVLGTRMPDWHVGLDHVLDQIALRWSSRRESSAVAS